MIEQKLLDILICPECSGRVGLAGIRGDKKLVCFSCQKTYLVIDDKPHMLEKQGETLDESSGDKVISKLKIFFKKYPKFYNFLYYILGAVWIGRSVKKIIESIGRDKLIINLGSGTKEMGEEVINVDFYPFIDVDIVADIYHLPFQDNSIDMAISEFVLEHTKNPQDIVREIHRVLKPDGLIYISVPFVASFHSAPGDYYRWSKEGLRELLRDFKETEIGIRCGPTSALVSVFAEWLAILLSFGSRQFQQILLIIFMVIISPLKIFDYLIFKLPNVENIAYGFYYIGEKKKGR